MDRFAEILFECHLEYTLLKLGDLIRLRPLFCKGNSPRLPERIYSRSRVATAPKMVSMNWPVGVLASMASFLNIKMTCLELSSSINFSRPFVLRAKREMLTNHYSVAFSNEVHHSVKSWQVCILAAGLVEEYLINSQSLH